MHALLLHLSAKKTGCCADKCTLRVTHFRFFTSGQKDHSPDRIAGTQDRLYHFSFKRITVIDNDVFSSKITNALPSGCSTCTEPESNTPMRS